MENAAKKIPAPIHIPLDAESQGLDRPENSRWHVETESGAFGFRERGRFSLLGFLYFGLLSIFWNGMVIVFFLALLQGPKTSVRLIFFAVALFFGWIGLNILYAFFYMVRLSCTVTRWIFFRDEAVERNVCLWFVRTKRFPLKSWRSMEIRIDTEEFDEEMPLIWELVFLDEDGTELFKIDTLSEEADARWMADVVLREQRSIR